jgi:DNA (cytosine-5)-methyltransferase 1
MNNIKVGSICSGIEAASVAWEGLGFSFEWFSEISKFPSSVLEKKYPNTPNLGDMCDLPQKLRGGGVSAPDLICGGTPCQAFSLAGWKKGLEDVRGNLTLKFVEIINSNDEVRLSSGKSETIIFWENVEGVLRDKTNAFGCFVATLAGFDEELKVKKWPQSGLIRGPKRNVAWRVIDAKHFGLPQQRRRLYLVAGGLDFNPEDVLFEIGETNPSNIDSDALLKFKKDGQSIEVFRHYADCLYAAYGTKWNGNAAAYNGSLFVLQEKRLRRFTPLECERLMGFPDNYTAIGVKVAPTLRYQAVGNSWAVPVVRWLGERIKKYPRLKNKKTKHLDYVFSMTQVHLKDGAILYDFGKELIPVGDGVYFNGSPMPLNPQYGNIFDIIDVEADEKFYITPVGCKGILRRKEERNLRINSRLEEVLKEISSTWADDEIEAVSRRQTRGRFSKLQATGTPLQIKSKSKTLPLWED